MAKTLDEAGVKRLIQEIKGANKNLNTAIPISTENTAESMAQNVKNIADYVEKAKAAGVANVNGMAVTCIIDDEYSGVGYLYSYNGGPIWVTGIITYDDTAVSPTAFFVDNEGLYNKRDVVIKDLSDQVTSDMLVEGARKPIILTPDTTEVDEETYQKLSQEGTDVILSLGDGNGSFIGLQGIFNTGDTLILMFGYSDFNESDGVIVTYAISINTSAPHTLTLAATGSCNPVPKSELISVLQEIDLTGTDAERKAKLDQFEADWKALTGASSLEGARFVGHISTPSGNSSMIFTWNNAFPCYTGIGFDDTHKDYNCMVQSDGSITITPLFSHLEAITIKTDNKPESKAANVSAIKAYVDNLKALGVDTTKGYMIPFRRYNSIAYGILVGSGENPRLQGYMNSDYTTESIFISPDGTVNEISLQSRSDAGLKTNSKIIVKAINEVNALAKGYSTPIELTTETAQNKTAIDARVAAFTAQGISLTNGCCIPVTYKGVYAGNISLINGDWYGLLVKNTNNPADNINIKLSADGTITEGNSAQ